MKTAIQRARTCNMENAHSLAIIGNMLEDSNGLPPDHVSTLRGLIDRIACELLTTGKELAVLSN